MTLPRFDVPYDCSVELSPLAYKFLTELFEVSDKVFSLYFFNFKAI